MKRTVLLLLCTSALFGQSVSGTAGQSAAGNKTDDQTDQTATPKRDRTNRRRNATTVPPARPNPPTSPANPSMPADPKTPTSPVPPRTPVTPNDPTRPEDPTKPVNPPPVK